MEKKARRNCWRVWGGGPNSAGFWGAAACTAVRKSISKAATRSSHHYSNRRIWSRPHGPGQPQRFVHRERLPRGVVVGRL